LDSEIEAYFQFTCPKMHIIAGTHLPIFFLESISQLRVHTEKRNAAEQRYCLHLGSWTDLSSSGLGGLQGLVGSRSHKLNPWSLDEGPRPKSGKSSLNIHDVILEVKSIGLDQKRKGLKERESS
jgi:hypothetical protein